MSIIIFSKPVRSGKTTELLNWCRTQNNIAGILMPDVDGARKIYNIKSREVFDAECTDAANTKAELIYVSRFHFYSSAFERANKNLLKAASENPDVLVIDEIGKLELNKQGFYTSVSEIISKYASDDSKRLILVAREELLERVIEFFRMTHYRVIHRIADLNSRQ